MCHDLRLDDQDYECKKGVCLAYIWIHGGHPGSGPDTILSKNFVFCQQQ